MGVLNDGIKRIKASAFGRCTSLERITIPSTISEIEQYVFRGCTGLREVVIHNEGLQIEGKAFGGCTPLERFKFPRLSTRLDNIIQAGQRDIGAKMDDISAVEWRGGELIIPAIRRQEREWEEMELIVEVDEEKLTKVKGLIVYYEIKEATTLFELALWKVNLDQQNGVSVDRVACRIEVPGPVKETILRFFFLADMGLIEQK